MTEKTALKINCDRLLCPECRIGGIRGENGILVCRNCGAVYPVWNGIPRLLTADMLPMFVTDYSGFVEKADQETRERLPAPRPESQHVTVFRGVAGRDYSETREKVATVKYSLGRRMQAVSEVLEAQGCGPDARVLELGCADGKISRYLSGRFGFSDIVGVDLQDANMDVNDYPCLQGDCQNLPFADEAFDVLVGAALIEHLPEPQRFLDEVFRVLSPGGIVVLTCPDPVFDWICTKIGYFKNACHLHRFNIGDVKRMLTSAGFARAEGRKFMLSPIKIDALERLEKSSLFQGWLRVFLMNQVVWGRKA